MELIGGIILAGGQSTRMGGGDKCLKMLGGKTLISRIIERVSPQISTLILNANGNPNRFSDYNLPVVPDVIGDHAGPLAGVLTGMEWMRKYRPEIQWLASFPGDAPFIPLDFVIKCLKAIKRMDVEIICAKSAGRAHPVCALWSVKLADGLRSAMKNDQIRKIDKWSSNYSVYHEEFSVKPIDPFFNINSEQDLLVAEALDKEGINPSE